MNDDEWRIVCDRISNVSEELVTLKQSSGGNITGPDATTKSRLNQIAVAIMELRQIHRKACLETERLRELTWNAKVTLDRSSLQLQNLLYERGHYEKEIQGCQSFQSKFSDDQLELLSEDAFAELPVSQDISPDADPHQRMLARLRHELSYRQEKVKDLEDLKSERDALAAEVAQRRGILSSLENELSSLLAMARNVKQKLEKEAG